MNDLLSALLRAADPGAVKRGEPLSERGLRELVEYEAKEAALAHTSRHPRRTPVMARRGKPAQLVASGLFVVMLIVAVVAVTTVVRPASAITSTPPLLDVTPVSATARELLNQMERRRRTGEGPDTTIRAQTWALNTTFAEDGTIESSAVEPQRSETTFLNDGSVRYRLVATEPFPGQSDASLPEPGTVLVDETFLPGDWDAPVEDGPPTEASEVGAYLAAFSGDHALSTGQMLREVSTIVSNYLLTREQEAALIGYLSTVSNIQVSGSAVDRLDRAGIVFSATDHAPGEYEDRLIISARTGQFLAAETIYTGSSRTDIPSPAVVEYTAWEH